MADDEIDELVKRYGAGTKLYRYIMRAQRWSEERWYAEWPALSLRLEAALERRANG